MHCNLPRIVCEVGECFPDLKKKVKIHRFLHLVVEFGSTSAFNMER